MNKISCDICMNLIPLVADDAASEDIKNSVLEHIETCEQCRLYYEKNQKPIMKNSKAKINIKKQLFLLAIAFMIIGVAFGIAIADGEMMFYNIIIMPFLGAVSYFTLKRKSLFALVFVFVFAYLRWLSDSFGYVHDGNFIQAFIPPVFWAFIYACLFALGILIASLLYFGFKKENINEKNS